VLREIQLKQNVAEEILHSARTAPLVEACGLLAGRDGVITKALPARNTAGQPATAYEIQPEELFRMMREIRCHGLELLGIYHSHPEGDNVPSERDVARAYYPDAAYLILSPNEKARKPILAFSIRDGLVSELEIQIV
jgi:[CysO sulfur-carrier protein]-S-L-cysteine hydrolase